MKKAIKLRLVFMGTSEFAKEILGSLIQEKYNVVSVYTRKDKVVGREKTVQKSAVKVLAEENNLPVFEVEKFDNDTVRDLKAQRPDILIVAAYGKILPMSVLKLPGFGALNVHASLLPKFRGPSPIQNALLENASQTGSTIMLMDEGIDTGDILSQAKINIGPNETYESLESRLAKLSSELLLKTLPVWIDRKIKPQPQESADATYCQLIERSDGKVNWSQDATDIYNRFRAFYPWPGIFTFFEINNFNQRLKLHRVSLMKGEAGEKFKIGEVFQKNGAVAVRAGQGAIILEEVQLEGKTKMDIGDFVNGYPQFVGSFLK